MKRTLIFLVAIFCDIAIINAQWQLSGNSISNGDFIGTTNSEPLVIKVNNIQAGIIDHIKYNSVLGYEVLLSNTTGGGNTGMGRQALYSNTTGSNNVFLGQISLKANTTGTFNTAIGTSTLWANISGSQNTAVGFAALDGNTTADNNVAVGSKTLFKNTTGAGNVGCGFQSLYNNMTVSNLTAIGYESLYSNTSGYENTAVGYRSLYSNTSGANNLANGNEALYSNISGSLNTATGFKALYFNTSGESNTAVGSQALFKNTIGGYNTAYGSGALFNNLEGGGNTAIGTGSLNFNEMGDINTAIGDGALSGNYSGEANTSVGAASMITNYSGSNNTAIGVFADVSANNFSNTTVIGYSVLGTASNQVRIGNSSVTSIGGWVNWTNLSDKRIKRNIQSDVPGLELINKLNPVTYNLDLDAANNIIQYPAFDSKDEKIKKIYNEMLSAGKTKEDIRYTGFIAQEVEEAAKSIGFNFSAVDEPKNDKDLYGLRYAEFVVPLVKAVQELSAQNNNLKKENEQLKTELNDLVKRMDALELKYQSDYQAAPPESSFVDEAKLEQNAPNPFSAKTIIRYYIPYKISDAKIVISDINGRIVKEVPVNSKGTGQTTIEAKMLASGSYIYSLFVNGVKADSKHMLLTR